MASRRNIPAVWAVAGEREPAGVWPKGRCQASPLAVVMAPACRVAPAARDHRRVMPPRETVDAITLRGVTKTFGPRGRPVTALAGVDLTVPRGRFMSVIGPSGCGKSTLLRIAAGLLVPDSGEVQVFGETPEQARRAKRVGLVPQTPALLPWRTVAGNVALPAQVNRGRGGPPLDPLDLLRRVGLADAAGIRPHQLSGGMAQRVAIARALVSQPSVLIMDEPFSALDELTREVLRRVLLDVWEADRKTVLFVTHSVSEAVQLSDEVVVLTSQPGRVSAVVAVPLMRPRPDGIELTDEFRDIEAQLRTALKGGWRSSAT